MRAPSRLQGSAAGENRRGEQVRSEGCAGGVESRGARVGEGKGLRIHGDQCQRDGEYRGNFCTYVILSLLGRNIPPAHPTWYPETLTAIVIVRRVVAARRLHASGIAPNPGTGLSANSASRTQPLTPLEEKVGSVEFAQRPGQTTKRGGFWARFKCW